MIGVLYLKDELGAIYLTDDLAQSISVKYLDLHLHILLKLLADSHRNIANKHLIF